ncbi:MAG: M28 family peptidase [Candidatus Helarchaeota archaeon]|nr:M28 family peptidase [Candidatus Helarchaeota archaeon]
MAKGKKKSTKKKKAAKKKPAKKKPSEEVKEEVPEEKAAEEEKEEAPEPPKPAEKPKPKPKKKVEKLEEAETDEYVRLEYKDTFDKERAFKHVEALAFPRMAGTEGEAKAADYIKDKFSGMGLKPVEEEFTFTNWVSKVLLRIFEGIEGGLVLGAVLLITFGTLSATHVGFIIGVILSIALLVLTFYSSITARFHYKYQNTTGAFKLFEGQEMKSKNIIAKIDCAKGKDAASGNIILMAHYDTKSQTWPMLLQALLFYISIILCIAIPVVYIGFYILVSLGMIGGIPALTIYGVLLALALIDVATIIMLALNKTENKSPGAIDNASGLGVFLELAQNYTKQPLEHYNLTFVATGAAEYGLYGAISFMKANESELDPEDTYFLNLKVAAVRGHFYLPGPVGFPPQFPCLEVENLFKKVLKRRNIPVKEGSRWRMRVLSPWVLPGSWNDDMIPVIRGYNANRISIGGLRRRLDVIHTPNDNIDHVDIEAVDMVGKVTAEVLTRLDLRARP